MPDAATQRPPRDGDGDGRIYDGKPHETDAPSRPQPQPQPAAAARTSPPQGARSPADADAVRTAVFDGVHAAASAVPAASNPRHTLAVENVAYEGNPDFSKAAQKRAILEGRTLSRRLRGDWVLRDASGAELSRRRALLADVPYMTPEGVFIIDGTHYSLASQMRLLPGVYTRRKSNGEIEAHANPAVGTGVGHRIYMEPATGRFRIEVGQAALPLMPLLRALGATDADLSDAWGADLLHANRRDDAPAALDRLHRKFVRDPDATPPGGRAEAVAAAFSRMRYSPEVVQETLGAPYDAGSKELLLATTKKVLAVARGEQQPDDRDHLAYMTALGPEDLLSERIARDRGTLPRLLWKASLKGDLSKIPSGVFTPHLRAVIQSSGLGQPVEGINPAQLLEQQYRITRMGVGGIGSTQAIPEESRAVQPSHYGFLDFVWRPENEKNRC